MITYKIYLNDIKCCFAGGKNMSLLTANLVAKSDGKIKLNVVSEHVHSNDFGERIIWLNGESLKLGDKLLLEVTDKEEVSEYIEYYAFEPIHKPNNLDSALKQLKNLNELGKGFADKIDQINNSDQISIKRNSEHIGGCCGFDVSVNSSHLFNAGNSSTRFMQALISTRSLESDETTLQIFGEKVFAAQHQFGWNNKILSIGDSVQIKIVDLAHYDEPDWITEDKPKA